MARLASLPTRLGAVARHNGTNARASLRWLYQSREHTNYTYDLSQLNLCHLAWWVANIVDIHVSTARDLIAEAMDDRDLAAYIQRQTRLSSRRWLADDEVRFHKRLGWYALIRSAKPLHVVETGTDKGLGSLVIAAALLKNGAGSLTTIDLNSESGYLIGGQYSEIITQIHGDSIQELELMNTPVSFFIHDSLHTREHEYRELKAVERALTEDALVLSDNSHVTDALPAWAAETGRRFHYFREVPDHHWYPGGGIGLAHR